MTRHMLFVLLLAACAVLADDAAEARQDTGAGGTQTQTHGAQERTEDGQTRSEAAQRRIREAQAETGEAQEQTDEDATLISVPGGTALGMSILGNQEAPTSLVIVPWKTSELGQSLGISPMLDDSRQPVDKDVFMRALRYYEIRSETSRGPRP